MLTSRPSKNITGSITKIEAAFMDDISKLQYYPVNNSLVITFKEGKSFSEVYFSKKSATLFPKADPTEQGKLNGFEIAWQNAGLEASEIINLSEASGALLIIRITDNNGSRLLFPYCTISFLQNIGQQHTNFTGVSIVASTMLPHAAPMDMSLNTTIPAIN